MDSSLKLNYIIVFVALAIEIIDLASLYFRLKKARKEKEEETVEFSKGYLPKIIGIFVFSVLLTLLCLKIYTGMIGNIILCACGVFGVEIGIRSLTKQE